MSLSDFLHMGGYGGYLWPAFGLTLFVLVYNIWSARRSLSEARSAAARRIRMEENPS